MPWRKPVVAGPSARRLGLADSADHVGFVVGKVALGQVSLRVLSVFALLLSPNLCAVLTSTCTIETIKSWQVTSLNKIQKKKNRLLWFDASRNSVPRLCVALKSNV